MNLSGPILLALLASLSFSLANICVKRGVQDTSVIAGLVISLGVGAVLALGAALAHPAPSLAAGGVGAFVAAGVAGLGIGRLASMSGVRTLGASVSTPILGCVYPSVAVVGGVLVLGERVEPLQLAGITVIIVGVWVLSFRTPRGGTTRSKGMSVALAFPMLAGLCYGAADATRKLGLDRVADPIFGTAVGMLAGFGFWAMLSLLPNVRARMSFGREGVPWFVLSGLFSAAAVFCLISALNVGKVALVSPIVASQPMMIMLLTPLFLRDLEPLDSSIVAGGTAVVIGTVLIAVSA